MAQQDQQEQALQAVVFIDADAPDVADLTAGLAPGVVAFTLNPGDDGLQQIATLLSDNDLTNLSSISIIGHGSSGEIEVGSTLLDAGDLASETPALAAIGAALAPGGDLALYACDVAEGAAGQNFIGALSQAAGGAAVSAATHLVGAASGGGSWTLDATSGGVGQGAAPFTAEALSTYAGELATHTLKLNGVNYVADVYGFFAQSNTLPQAVAAGLNAIAVVADFGIDAENDTVYDNDVNGGFTESDADISTAMSQASALGLGVMVRPLIDFLPPNYLSDPGGTNPLNAGYYAGQWRSDFNPGAAGSAGANAFFASYQSMLVDQAKLAQAGGAAIFSIGVELDQIAGPSYQSYWTSIITAVRAVFSGALTYGADWDDADSPWQYGGTGLPVGTGDITTQISFWRQLDYVGIDEYAPISDAANPTVAQLVAGWAQIPTDPTTLSITGDQSLISYYESVAAATGKPLLFTEIGYANSSDAASSPATPGYDEDGNPDGATADPTLQANLYAAFYQAWEQDGNGSLAGAYLWNWSPAGAGDNPFTVQGLPGQTTLTNAAAFGVAPAVTSITTSGAGGGARSEAFTVTFSQAVTGVAASDFTVTTATAASGPALTTSGVSSVSGAGTTYVVTVGGVSGVGTLGLDFKANSVNVVNASGDDAMAGFTGGETYSVDVAPCYARGSRILTTRGEVAVEALRVGDVAITAEGARRPIVWIGRRALDLRRHRDPAAVQPVRVRAGAFGPGAPARDLWLSPGHSVAFEGALTPVSRLVNDRSVRQTTVERVEYWHVELDAHDILLAEGLPAESYLDCGNRADFANGAAFISAHPDFSPRHWSQTCLPLRMEGPSVVAAKARLLERLAQLGERVVQEGDAHIVIDGVRVDPVRRDERRLAFALPAGGRDIALCSRTFVPAHTVAESLDIRVLGLCVARLEVDGRALALELDAMCGGGWREAEFAEGRFSHRWTCGRTALPPGAVTVTVELAGVGHYWAEAVERPALSRA